MQINTSMSTLVRLLTMEICPQALLWVMKRSEQMDGKLTIERNTVLYLILRKHFKLRVCREFSQNYDVVPKGDGVFIHYAKAPRPLEP